MNKNSYFVKLFKLSIFVFSFILVFTFAKNASAGTSDHTLAGWLWSDNIGWVSLNCSDTSSCSTSQYGVVIDYVTGELSGMAWSSNVGWISFNKSQTTGCPSSTYGCAATAVLKSSGASNSAAFPHVVGWAKALSVNTSTNKVWDGWISLSCYNTNTCSTSNYGVVLPNNGTTSIGTTFGYLSGYAWGSTTVGWIDVAYVNVTPGSSEITLVSDKASVSSSTDTVTLTWDSPKTNTVYSSCTASGGGTDWNGSVSTTFPASKTVTVPNDPTTFSVSCSTGTVTDTATVDVDIDYVWDLSLNAIPDIVTAGMSSTFSWATTGAAPNGTNCEAVAPTWTTSTSQSGSQVISNILTGITHAYRCTPPGPNTPKTATASVKILKLDHFRTDACYRPSQGGPTIEWQASNATGCSVTYPNSYVRNVGPSGISGFNGGDGNYTISCNAGSLSVNGVLTDNTINKTPISAIACTPDYQMVSNNICNGKAGQETDNAFQKIGTTGTYQAFVKVTAVPESGFTDPLNYKFTAPAAWAVNGWTVSQWGPTPNPGEYESGTLNHPNYSSTIKIVAPSIGSLAGLSSMSKQTETFAVGADRTVMSSMPRTGNYTICAPDGGGSKPIFIEQ